MCSLALLSKALTSEGPASPLLTQRLCSSETDRQSNEWIDPICRRRHANIHSSIQLDVFGQLIGEACSEDDRIAS